MYAIEWEIFVLKYSVCESLVALNICGIGHYENLYWVTSSVFIKNGGHQVTSINPDELLVARLLLALQHNRRMDQYKQ